MEIREQLEAGASPLDIQSSFRAKYGNKALAIPSDQGLDRALWAFPVAAMLAAVGLIVMLGRRCRDAAMRTTSPWRTLD
jgi:cytochrome c-type biogenesis protein CcmH/NrfF